MIDFDQFKRLDFRGDTLFDRSGNVKAPFTNVNDGVSLGYPCGMGKGSARFTGASSRYLSVPEEVALSTDIDMEDFAFEVIVMPLLRAVSFGVCANRAGGNAASPGYHMNILSSGILVVNIADGTTQDQLTGSDALSGSELQHVMVTVDRDGQLFTWIDGEQDNNRSVTLTDSMSDPTAGYGIGSRARGGGNEYSGLIYRLRMWNLGVGGLTMSMRDDLISQAYNEHLRRRAIGSVAKSKYFVYSAPVDLSHETYNVGAWNMEIQNGKVRGIDGSGIDFTPSGILNSEGIFGGALRFAGAGVLSKTIADYRSEDSSGSILIRFKASASGSYKALLSSSDIAGDNNFLTFGINQTTGVLRISFKDGGAQNDVLFTTDVTDDVWHIAEFKSDGSSYTLILDGADDPVTSGINNGNWFADVSDRDNVTVGALTRSSTDSYLLGVIDSINIYRIARSIAKSKIDYNQFAGLARVVADFDFEGADGLNKLPEGWLDDGTAVVKVAEDIVSKYMECVTGGDMSLPVDLSDDSENGFIAVLVGDLSDDAGKTVDDASNVSYGNNRLSFTLITGDKIRRIEVQRAALVAP